MATPSIKFRLDHLRPGPPLLSDGFDYFSADSGMIDRCDQNCLRFWFKFCYAGSDRGRHGTVRIGVGCEPHIGIYYQRLSDLVSAMADDNDQIVYASRTKIPDARFDHRDVAEGKQRFECSHSPGPSGGQNDSSN